MLLLCPHSAIQNLPQPRIQPPSSLVGASAVLVGQVVQGVRLAEAHGRFISNTVHGSMTALGPGAPDLGVSHIRFLPNFLIFACIFDYFGTPNRHLLKIWPKCFVDFEAASR